MANERITEDIVREHFKRDPLFSKIKFEKQQSSRPKIDKLLKNASKKGTGKGYPEFIISELPNADNLVIVVECKANANKHESKKQDKYDKYAVDGALLYSDYLSKEYDILSIAVSGTSLDDLRISHFLQKKKRAAEPIFAGSLLPIEDYLGGYKQDEAKRQEKYEDILAYSKILNEDLHKIKIREDKRSLLLSGILIALKHPPFYKSYKNYNGQELADNLLSTIHTQFSRAELQRKKLDKLKQNYSFIVTHDSLSKEKNSADRKTLKNIIDDIDSNINSFARTYRYYDVLGQFYVEFLRYSNSDKGLGIVLTPPHITDFFAEIADIKKTDIVYDNCTGTGGFLVTAMKKMIKLAQGKKKQEKSIKSRQFYGVEYQPEIYPLAVSNMFLHGDGKSNILDGDCFDKKIMRTIKDKKPTVGFLNPPYKSSKKDDIEEMEFLLNNLEVLQEKGCCVAIIPMSCILAQKGIRLELKRKLLQKHTLKAVFSMPDELFYNSKVMVVTAIVVVEAHVPHPSRNKVFFGYYKNDGFVKKKNTGRVDFHKQWSDIKEEWLTLYASNESKAGLSIFKKIVAEDEWCAEAYMNTDNSLLTNNNFKEAIKNYVAFEFLREKLHTSTHDAFSSRTLNLFNRKWDTFNLSRLFTIKSSKDPLINELEDGIDTPYISSTEFNNGVVKYSSLEATNKGNVLTVNRGGSVGHTFYQKDSFLCTPVDVRILEPLFPFNIYLGIFLSVIITNEKYRFNYSRKMGTRRLEELSIKLPVDKQHKPDWKFMEDYIKSLPYSKNLEAIK